MLTLSIFVSSPGDVADERASVRRVTDELENSHLLRGKVHFRIIAWDDPNAASPMEAGVTPQASVNRYTGRPADCDLTLVILWSRIGTVLPPDMLRADGSRFESGTVWEFEDAASTKRPVWIYRRTGKPQIDIDDPDFDAKRSQYAAVKSFFDKFRNADESLRSGINNYADPADFARQFRQHLEAFVNERLSRNNEPVAAQDPNTFVKKPVPRPVLRLPQHAILGRDKLIGKVLAGLQADQHDFAFVYLPGVGKTAVAAELIGNEAIMQHFPDGVLWAHLGQDPDVNRQLSKWAKALGISKEDIADCKGAGELVETVAQAIGENRMLLVIDDVWATEAGEPFMIGAPNCTRIITTRYKNIARELMPDADSVLEVRKLTPQEGFQLLSELAPHAARVAPEALHQLARHVDGLPIALVLIGKMLKREGDDEQATHTLLQTLADIGHVFHEKKPLEYAETHNFSLGEVVEASYSALGRAGPLSRCEIPGEQLRKALDALSVLRPDPAWFPVALARLVSGAPDKALKALVDAGLIETVLYHPGDDKPDHSARYTMHRMISEYIRAKLPPQRLQELNRLAAGYYLERLTDMEKSYQADEATSYKVMYRYEDPEWQDCQDNWLYYFAQTGYDSEANISFLRAWFDGFWWWSCFTAEGYDFCDELLNDWDYRLSLSTSSNTTAVSLNRDRIERIMHGLELLRRFKRAYPKETEDRSGGAWMDVSETLNELRQRAGLDVDLALLPGPHAHHVRALTDIFLAEAERFGHGNIAAAETYYREALALFRAAKKEGEKEDWNVAWALYHLADMLGGCEAAERREEAQALGLEATEVGRANSDHEVVALAHRLLGDIALTAKNGGDALHHYLLAVESAYRFQVHPENPDPYTIQFYADLSGWVAGRLLANYATMPELAQPVMEGLRQAWLDSGAELEPLSHEDLQLGEITVQRLIRQLFPPSLPLERLKAEGDAYAERVKAHLAAINAGRPGLPG